MKTVTKLLPGCALALVIAAIAKLLESLEASAGLHLIGASVIALFIGMLVNHFYRPNDATKPGIRFTSKKILKFAIILLGASLNITTVLTVGKFSLTVMLFTLATCFGLGYFIGKALGLNWKTSSLINAGTGICGGSAIAAIAPVIDATDMDVAYGLSATFLFDMVMVVVFPILGRKLGLSDAAFGLWAGTAVNDTSSVVATGYAFSEAAGDFATMVKLTRTLSIIPTVLVFAVISLKLKKKGSGRRRCLRERQHEVRLSVVHSGLSCPVGTYQPRSHPRLRRLRTQDAQQVPHGRGARCGGAEHRLQSPLQIRCEADAPWLHHFAARRSRCHRRGVHARHCPDRKSVLNDSKAPSSKLDGAFRLAKPRRVLRPQAQNKMTTHCIRRLRRPEQYCSPRKCGSLPLWGNLMRAVEAHLFCPKSDRFLDSLSAIRSAGWRLVYRIL